MELDAVDFITSARDCVIWDNIRVGLGRKWPQKKRANKGVKSDREKWVRKQ